MASHPPTPETPADAPDEEPEPVPLDPIPPPPSDPVVGALAMSDSSSLHRQG